MNILLGIKLLKTDVFVRHERLSSGLSLLAKDLVSYIYCIAFEDIYGKEQLQLNFEVKTVQIRFIVSSVLLINVKQQPLPFKHCKLLLAQPAEPVQKRCRGFQPGSESPNEFRQKLHI